MSYITGPGALTGIVLCEWQESQPLKGGRGSASLVIKCKLCSRENSIGIPSAAVTMLRVF